MDYFHMTIPPLPGGPLSVRSFYLQVAPTEEGPWSRATVDLMTHPNPDTNPYPDPDPDPNLHPHPDPNPHPHPHPNPNPNPNPNPALTLTRST